MKAAVDQARFASIVDKMREAAEVKMQAKLVPQVVELASKEYSFSESEGQGILGHLIEGGDLSLYGLANAVTRQAQDVESYDRSTELEAAGAQSRKEIENDNLQDLRRKDRLHPLAEGRENPGRRPRGVLHTGQHRADGICDIQRRGPERAGSCGRHQGASAPQVRREVESYAVIHPKNRTYAQRTPGREKRKTARTVEKLSSLLRVDDPIVILPHFCGNCKREVLL